MNFKVSINKLNDLSKKIIENFDDFIYFFDLDLIDNGSCYIGSCPLHEGSDNQSAFIIYKNTGIWRCNTRGCHNCFKKTSLGLIRGLLSKNKRGWKCPSDTDKVFSFPATVNFVEQFLDKKPKKQLLDKNKHYKNKKPKIKTQLSLNWDIDFYKSKIDRDTSFFENKSFNKDILDKFYVGVYKEKYNILYDRVCVPIFNDEGNLIIGLTGRVKHEKCLVCNGYHPIGENCVDPAINRWDLQKWVNNKGFNKSREIYNFWNAKKYIQKTKKVFIVEGPSDVWKLEQAGCNSSVAVMGSDISDYQKNKLRSLNIEKIVTITDNDEAGIKLSNVINESFSDLKIRNLVPLKNDVGEMSEKEIDDMFKKHGIIKT